MKPAERELLVKLNILKVLQDCGDYALPETALHTQVNLQLQPVALKWELTLGIQQLQEQNAIVGAHPELGGPTRWKLTTTGKQLLAEYA